MTSQVLGLIVLALLLTLVALALEANRRRPRLPSSSGDADTRRLLRELEFQSAHEKGQ